MDFFGDFSVKWTYFPNKLFHLVHFSRDERGPYIGNLVYLMSLLYSCLLFLLLRLIPVVLVVQDDVVPVDDDLGQFGKRSGSFELPGFCLGAFQ